MDPYLTDVDTVVTYVQGEKVRVEKTIFFALSGGQESDSGTLGGYPVLLAEKQGLDIVYTLPSGHLLKQGDIVTVSIDWERRYSLMRHHFAAEMVLQMVYRLRPGIDRIGAHISSDKARIDFSSETSLAPLFPEIEQEAARLTSGNMAIITAFSDEEAERRYWKVEGFAEMACGGTHPRSTNEVGAVKLKRKNQGKGKERIEITLLRQAR